VELPDMKKITLSICLLFCAGTPFAQNYPVRNVTVAGRKMACRSFGLENRKPGDPVIIFESGLGMPGDNFEVLFNNL
jgi:hypothetical protein